MRVNLVTAFIYRIWWFRLVCCHVTSLFG